jgi:vacuolar protein 8
MPPLASRSEDIVHLVKIISDKNLESDEEDVDEGEGEVITLGHTESLT